MAASSSSAATLSSVASTLTDLTNRITALATEAAAQEEDLLAGELFEVERHLTAASRRIERLLRHASTP